jgi:hypothetical protein
VAVVADPLSLSGARCAHGDVSVGLGESSRHLRARRLYLSENTGIADITSGAKVGNLEWALAGLIVDYWAREMPGEVGTLPQPIWAAG